MKFEEDQEVSILIDSGSKINAITLVCIAKLGLVAKFINVGT